MFATARIKGVGAVYIRGINAFLLHSVYIKFISALIFPVGNVHVYSDAVELEQQVFGSISVHTARINGVAALAPTVADSLDVSFIFRYIRFFNQSRTLFAIDRKAADFRPAGLRLYLQNVVARRKPPRGEYGVFSVHGKETFVHARLCRIYAGLQYVVYIKFVFAFIVCVSDVRVYPYAAEVYEQILTRPGARVSRVASAYRPTAYSRDAIGVIRLERYLFVIAFRSFINGKTAYFRVISAGRQNFENVIADGKGFIRKNSMLSARGKQTVGTVYICGINARLHYSVDIKFVGAFISAVANVYFHSLAVEPEQQIFGSVSVHTARINGVAALAPTVADSLYASSIFSGVLHTCFFAVGKSRNYGAHTKQTRKR